MVEFDGFGHINIITDDIETAADYYVGLLGAKKVKKSRILRTLAFQDQQGL